MDEGTTTFGLSPKHMARLLGMGVEREEHCSQASAEMKAEVLRARFAGPLPFEATVIEMLPMSMGTLCQELLPQGGRSLKEVLLDEKTDLRVISKVKEYGRELAGRAEPERSVGIALYYAAIASALLFHDTKLTNHPYGYLRDSFGAMDTEWMPEDLAEHIEKAQRICGRRAGD